MLVKRKIILSDVRRFGRTMNREFPITDFRPMQVFQAHLAITDGSIILAGAIVNLRHRPRILEGVYGCGLLLHCDRFVKASQRAKNPRVQMERLGFERVQFVRACELLDCHARVPAVEKNHASESCMSSWETVVEFQRLAGCGFCLLQRLTGIEFTHDCPLSVIVGERRPTKGVIGLKIDSLLVVPAGYAHHSSAQARWQGDGRVS